MSRRVCQRTLPCHGQGICRRLPRALAGRSRTVLALLLTLALGLSGCMSTQSQARQAAAERWNRARAQVKAKLASDQLTAGNVDAAATELGEALRLDPANPELSTLQARVCLAQGDLAAAERLLERAQREGKSGAEIDYLLGLIYEQRLRWPTAREFFARAADQDPQELAYAVAYVQVMLQLDKADEALLFLHSREDQFGWTSGHHAARAECHEQLEEWAEAASAWQRVVDANDDPGTRERLAMAHFQAGNWTEAIRHFQQLLVEHDSPALAPLRLALAECLLNDGQVAAAHEQLSLLLRDDPRNVAVLRLTARASARQGQFERARQAAEQAWRLAPDDPQSLELAAALAFRAGDKARAYALARHIRQRFPGADSPVARRILDHSTAPSADE